RMAIVGDAAAGVATEVAVRPGLAVRIATGAPVPAGADAVVPVEETTPLGADARPTGPRGRDASGPLPAFVDIHQAVHAGDSIRRRGSDLDAGARILARGDRMTPQAIALAAGSGVTAVEVHRRPRVAVLATGDEVRGPGEPLGAAGIPDANGPGL